MPTVHRALDRRRRARCRDVDAVAVTAGPGLAGALLVGVAAAKAYALALDVPLYGVNHLAAHVAVDELEHGPLPEPAIAMLVSGGHQLAAAGAPTSTADVEPLGAHRRRRGGGGLRQGRPGARPAASPAGRWSTGPPREGDPGAIAFPRARLAARRDLRLLVLAGSRPPSPAGSRRGSGGGAGAGRRRLRAASRRRSSTCSPPRPCAPAATHGVEHLLIGGGVAANSRLRALAQERCDAAGIVLRVPRPGLCTDNGAMVAALGQPAGRGRRRAAARSTCRADSAMDVREVVSA